MLALLPRRRVAPQELRGTRNLAWLAVWKDHATITFYLAARHREALVALPIPDSLRHQAAQAKMMGRMLPIVIDIRSQADAETAPERTALQAEAK